MKVLNLRCGQQHAYEGWFASEEDFTSQQERGIVACPWCGGSGRFAPGRDAQEAGPADPQGGVNADRP